MTLRVLQTERLILRPLELADAHDLARLIADWEVAKWLTSVPWPYALADALSFLGDGMARTAYGIEADGALIGVVGLHAVDGMPRPELGYWLGRRFWGAGLMSEAAGAVVQDYFQHGASDGLASGYLLGNAASAHVLAKLGFEETEIVQRYCTPQDKELPLQRMQLDRATWNVRCNR